MNEERKQLTIIDKLGNKTQVEVVVAFKIEAINKDYVVYTMNQKDENGNITLYASTIEEINGEKQLVGIRTDEEWQKIKEIIRELAKVE